eukprot:1940682-Amphidinium_carterae.1
MSGLPPPRSDTANRCLDIHPDLPDIMDAVNTTNQVVTAITQFNSWSVRCSACGVMKPFGAPRRQSLYH